MRLDNRDIQITGGRIIEVELYMEDHFQNIVWMH